MQGQKEQQVTATPSTGCTSEEESLRIARKIDDLRKRDRNFALVVVAEAVLTEAADALRKRG